MKHETLTVHRHIGGGVGHTQVQVEVFESVAEAVQFLGEEKALKFLNYAHSLDIRSKAHQTIKHPNAKPAMSSELKALHPIDPRD